MPSSSSTLDLPVIDLEPFLVDPTSEAALEQSKKAAETLIKYSALAIRDPRVNMQDNATFIDMVEDYFNQPYEVKLQDVRKEYSFQVGATPGNQEVPKCGNDQQCLDYIEQLDEQDKPSYYDKPDPKWRFFWRIGERPQHTKFNQLNAPQVIPKNFPEWESKMNTWGTKMHSAVSILSEMVAVGLGLDREAFTRVTNNGPHLLAPTASDLNEYGKLGTVLAGFHYDLNFLTIHGRSRFPGLFIWSRQGKKLQAKIPEGCLLVQAGKEMEWLTGGTIECGYHEVVVCQDTLSAIERQKSLNRPLWRISSTLFFHVASDQILKPFEKFATAAALKSYPATYCGDYVKAELEGINLSFQ